MTVERSGALVSAEELAAMLGSASPPVVLDVRWRLNSPSYRPDYDRSHVPGARWCDLETDLADPPGVRGRHPLPDVARLQQRFVDWGIDPTTTVVVHDLDDSVAAARAWWVLRWAGLESVFVLDGGWSAWQAAGLPQSDVVPPAGGGTARVRPGSLPSIDAAGAMSVAASGVLVDVRAAERFRGEVEPIDPVAGHIPGAINLGTMGNVGPDGRFLDAEALRARFTAVIEHSGPVGVYCGSGVTAAHTVLALHEIGMDAALYAGSWSEWITDPTRPIGLGD